MPALQLNGKEYTFRYIPANLFIKAKKVLKVIDPHIKAMQDFNTPEGEEDGHLKEFERLWPEFCDLVFEGERPIEISIDDVLEVVRSFFALRITTQPRPKDG
jgi:hypothetical protein